MQLRYILYFNIIYSVSYTFPTFFNTRTGENFEWKITNYENFVQKITRAREKLDKVKRYYIKYVIMHVIMHTTQLKIRNFPLKNYKIL